MAEQLRTFTHDRLTFDVDDTGGDGDVAVLLHGFPQTKASWADVAPALSAAGYRVLAPDQRGYSPGARPPRRRDYAMGHLVGDVLALADAAGAARFHVVGHDWGGAVAWALGATHPERLASLTSLSTPHPRAMVGSLVRSTQALRSWYMGLLQLPWLPERLIGSDAGARRFRAILVDSGLPEHHAEACMALLHGGGAHGAMSWYRAIPFGSPQAAGDITVPTLYVYGAQDFALTRAAADLTGRHVTGPYRYEVLDGAGHWLPEAAAHEVSALLLDHLAAHPL